MAVDALHPQYSAALPQWEKCRDAAAGEEAVHLKGEKYLPKLSEQTTEEYAAYKCRALYYNGTGRTVDGLTGLIFRRPPTMDIPESVAYLQDDIDTAGTPLLVMCEKVAEDLTKLGRVGLLTDYPPTVGIRTLADERAAGARPFVKIYPAESIINWRVERVGNQSMLTLVVLKEIAAVAKDDFESVGEDRWRVLKLVDRRYMVEVWKKAEKTATGVQQFVLAEQPYTPMMANRPMNFIPFAITGPMGIDADVAKSPILDLANVNLSHYRSTADYEHGLHFTALPTPIVTGHTFDTGETMALGSSKVKAFDNPQAKAFFLEFQGEGLSNISKRLEEKEQMMVSLGARMLASQQKGVEAAETAAIHRSAENSVLASLSNGASAAISKALTWCAMWVGVQEPVKVELNTDYLPTGMSAQELTSMVDSWQKGAISHETLYDNLQRGEIAQQGVSFEDEQARLELEGPPLGLMGEDDPAAGPTTPPKPGDPATPPAPGAPAASPAVASEPAASPAPAAPAQPAFDATAFSQALASALGPALAQAFASMPATVVNIPQQAAPNITNNVTVPEQPPAQVTVNNTPAAVNIAPSPVTVNSPPINIAPTEVTVNMAEQPAPVVNVTTAPVTVEPAEIVVNVAPPPAPVVNIAPTQVTIEPAQVNVTVEKPAGKVAFTEDAAGNINGATLE